MQATKEVQAFCTACGIHSTVRPSLEAARAMESAQLQIADRWVWPFAIMLFIFVFYVVYTTIFQETQKREFDHYPEPYW